MPDDEFTPWKVYGVSGPDTSPVIVLPVETEKQVVSWPRIDPSLAMKVRGSRPNSALWLTTCGKIYWLQ